MRVRASDFYGYERPSKCGLRVFLRERGEPEKPPGPYQEVLQRLGERHELQHLVCLGDHSDLSVGSEEQRVRRTVELVRAGEKVLYQPFLRATLLAAERTCMVVGAPDFLIKQDDGYVIRDSKLSRRITETDHPEVLRQLELYGWLYAQTFGEEPAGLQIRSGTGEIVDVPFDGGVQALEALAEMVEIRSLSSEPYSPVGWTKCGACGFRGRCWPRAEASRDVALVLGVDQGLALSLRAWGTETVEQLLAEFDEERLANLKRRAGHRFRKVGKRAGQILLAAQALSRGEEITLAEPRVPVRSNYVMFDLEGLPPQLDELDKIYLWGLQVFGEDPGEFLAATAGFGADGDREGWETFLAHAESVLERHGDIPFVHWHHYERTRLDRYIERFGDPDGTAARVKTNLLDLFAITRESVALPVPSYSLKVVESHIGFERTLEEYGGDWAMAKYIEATETEDETQRDAVMKEILAYNQEDLEATWAVMEWLREKEGN